MNATMQYGSAAQGSIELLAAKHYEQLYAFFNAFHDDPALCLDMVNTTLRAAESCDLTTMCIFTKAVSQLNAQPGLELPVWTSSYESNLCWLLRDIGGLRYSEIGAILEMSREEVKQRIAEVRFTVLEHLAA
ncbi:MAG TPA: hypothetical protein VF678_07975 [bacterium]